VTPQAIPPELLPYDAPAFPVFSDLPVERGIRIARLLRLGVAASLVVSAAAMACSGPEPRPTTSSPPPSPSGAPPRAQPSRGDVRALRLRLAPVSNIRNAVSLAVGPVDGATYVASRGGRVYRLGDGGEKPHLVLDLSQEVLCCEGEQGMFALVFSSGGARAYVSFTDVQGDLRIVEFTAGDGTLIRGSRRDVLIVKQRSVRHYGGSLSIGPDGHLYIGVGDGSLGSDPTGEAQSRASLRGKLLRIDPRPSERGPYRIPQGNPFTDRAGDRPEIFALGLRNPWRFSFDRITGDLWIGDVGHYAVEEIDFLAAGQAAGANLGWNRLEGSRRFDGRPPPDHVLPVVEYGHADGRCAVIGGYVYRGTRIADLAGWYLFADLCDGRVRALQRGGRVSEQVLDVQLDGLVSFAEDEEGEIYLLSLYRGIYRLAAR
jgi:glucose/arabinose dehydrogenase